MTSFRWDPASFALAPARFQALAADVDDYLYPMFRDNVLGWHGDAGILNLIMIGNHKLGEQLTLSAVYTADELRWCAQNIGDTGADYRAAEDKAHLRVERIWSQMGADDPNRGGPDLERNSTGGEYDFGSDLPARPYPKGPDFEIDDVVDRIISLGFLVPEGEPNSEIGKRIWHFVMDDLGVRELVDSFSTLLSGDWAGWYRAGDAMCAAAGYWSDLTTIGRRAAGTFFRGWDGDASEVAERFFAQMYSLIDEASGEVRKCGDAYKLHAYGTYLLFLDVRSGVSELVDQLRLLLALLDEDPGVGIGIGLLLANAERIVGHIAEEVAKVIGKLLLVAKLVEAVVALVLAAAGFFAQYKNKLPGQRVG